MNSVEPRVVVVVPFHNTAVYLEACLSSILAQDYGNFVVVLLDNQSDDGSERIAQDFASRDSRIQLIRNSRLLDQVANYNEAARHVPTDAQYVKYVQADDIIFPNCLKEMVRVGLANPTASIITSYYLKGPEIRGKGVEWPVEMLSGREAAELHLLKGHFIFGSPSVVMYRADVVRRRDPLFPLGCLHEDTELVYEELMRGDIGFVHQILSYLRVRDDSILGAMSGLDWEILDLYVIVKKFGAALLRSEDYVTQSKLITTRYRNALGRAVITRAGAKYWSHHARGLRSCGERVPGVLALLPNVMRALIWAARHPRTALARLRQEGR